jgi:hypothetical protein
LKAPSRADPPKADSPGADLSRAELSRADLSRTDLSKADLSRAALLDEALRRYIRLEKKVQALITPHCRETCGACGAQCCRKDICDEAHTAPWLRLCISRPGAITGEWDPERGFLSPTGCRLWFGRPPLCYDFACHRLLKTFASDERKYYLRCLFKIMTRVGERFLPHAHLVEVLDLGDMTPRRLKKLLCRIAMGETLFAAVKRRLRGDSSVDADLELLRRHFPPKRHGFPALAERSQTL